MNDFQRAQVFIMAELAGAPAHRARPRDLEKRLSARLGLSPVVVRGAMRELVEDGELCYTYRDPDSFVELAPVQPHGPARPMKVVTDAQGNSWLCDADADPAIPPSAQGCWNCGELAFTRND